MRIWRLGAVLLAAVAFGGCGGDDGAGADGGAGKVTIHASEVLPGSDDFVRAYRLALEERDGRAGRFEVELVVHDNSGASGEYDPALSEKAAKATADDERAVAYLGETNSAACAASAPILNRAGVLQVSSACTNPGLTTAGEFRPGGTPTFTRTTPSDDVQGRAIVAALRRNEVRRPVLVVGGDLFGEGLAKSIRAAAREAGIELIEGAELFGTATPDQALPLIRKARADAVVFSGGIEPAIVRFQAEQAPDLPLYVPDAASDARFLEEVRGATDGLWITAPLGGRGPEADAFKERFRRDAGRDFADLRAAYAYESMRTVLDAIERAGARGDDRRAVRDAFFATRDRESIVGRFSIDENGDTTLSDYGLYRVRDRTLELEATLRTR